MQALHSSRLVVRSRVGRVLSVNPDAMTTRWLDPASKSAKGWLRMQARSRKAEEKAAVKEDNKAAKEAQAKAK